MVFKINIYFYELFHSSENMYPFYMLIYLSNKLENY